MNPLLSLKKLINAQEVSIKNNPELSQAQKVELLHGLKLAKENRLDIEEFKKRVANADKH